MANPQGGQGQSQGQGGHGQTFTAAQHDKSLGRESQGPGVRHGSESEGREVVEGAESTIERPDERSFAAGDEAGDLDDDAGEAMEPQVDQTTGQGIVGGS